MPENPVTPAANAAATPGNNGQSAPQSSAAPSTQSGTPLGQEGKPDDKVTIPLKEYRDLQRDHARVLSFDKRKQFNSSRNNNAPGFQPANNGSGENNDPEIVEQLRVSQERTEAAERESLQLKVKDGVRTILAKPEFANLPESTKNLILKNPAMLSEANNVDEALLDIEDYIRETASTISTPNQNQSGQGGGSRSTPPGHEVPPTVSVGAAAPTNAEGLEDTSSLTGVARSRAVLRNAAKKARGIKQ